MKRIFFGTVFALFVLYAIVGFPLKTEARGRLVKGGLPAVYYLADDGKRYVFPNEKTYFTWYGDFSSIEEISDGELARYSLGGNVTYRPGTRLLKIQSDPRVYAIEPGGVFRHLASESVALALYGSAWAKRVDDLPDGFFPAYRIGASLAAPIPPEGSLLADASGARFVVRDGLRRPITDAAFAQNGFDASFALVGDWSAIPLGEPVGSELAILNDTAELSSVSRQAEDLCVAIAPSSPFVLKDSDDETLAAFAFSLKRPVRLDRLSLRVRALTNADPDADPGGLVRGDNLQNLEANFSDLHLVDASGNRVGASVSLVPDEDGDGVQDVQISPARELEAGTHRLRLVADTRAGLPEGERYDVTLNLGNSAFSRADGAAATFAPSTLSSNVVESKEGGVSVRLVSAVSRFVLAGESAQAIEAFSFSLENARREPVVVRELTLTGLIDEGEGSDDFAPGGDQDDGATSFVRELVASVTLRSETGTPLVGSRPVPDDGRVRFEGLDLTLPAQGRVTVRVQAQTSGAGPLENGSDRVAFDVLAPASDIDAETAAGANVDVTGNPPNGGSAPATFLTFSEGATLTASGQGSGPPTVLMGTASNTLYNLKFAATEEEGVRVDTVTMRFADATSARDVSSVSLRWNDAAGAHEKSVPVSGGSVTFRSLGLLVPADDDVDVLVSVAVSRASEGAVSGDGIGFAFEPSTFEATGLRSGFRFDRDELGEKFVDATRLGTLSTVRKSRPLLALSSTQPSVSPGRSSAAPVLRFTMGSEGDGDAQVHRLAFKIETTDVGYNEASTTDKSDNDLLEDLADLDGDAADDNAVAELEDENRAETVGEGGSNDAAVDFFVYDASAKARDDTPQGLDTARGDYGVLVYDFHVPLTVGPSPRDFLFSLDTRGLAPGNQAVTVTLLDGEDFAWSDGVSSVTREIGEGVNQLPVKGKPISF